MVYSAFMDKHLAGMQGLGKILEKRTSEIRICCGHLHRAFMTNYSGCNVVGCPSLSFEVELDFTQEGGNNYIESGAQALLHTVELSGRITSQVLQIPGTYSFNRYSFL